jgi:uncharacterized membrane protein
MLKSVLLGRVPLFSGMAESDLKHLAERLRERVVHAGEPIFSKGEPGAVMYVILSGEVRVFLPPPTPGMPPVVLKELHPGEYFGELSLLDDQPRSASTEAIADSFLGELHRADLLTYLKSSESAILSLLGEMSHRLRQTNAMLSERAAKDVVREVDEKLNWGQRLADRVANMNGSWTFILFLIGLTGIWFLVNQILKSPFDAYPYQFFNLFLAILVALQGPLIMMSQNRQSLKDRITSETDFRVNLKNEIAIEQILRELAALRADIKSRAVSSDSARSASIQRAG